MNRLFTICIFSLFLLFTTVMPANAVDGSDLWLARPAANPVKVVLGKHSPAMKLAAEELKKGWQGTAGARIKLMLSKDPALKNDGFRLDKAGVTASTETGILYGVFDLLRRQATGEPTLGIVSNPSYRFRILNHWDNPDGSIERGYAGLSIFWRGQGDQLNVTDADRALWKQYARANASIGLNGAVLDNVNAQPFILREDFLKRAAAIADECRPYGMKVYLSINFASPKRLGKLKTSDPLDPEVMAWWTAKVQEIYRFIPDFGGFLVKANSEGQSGPQDYGRTHADGANMLADALKPFNGIVMWRAFVYQPNEKDRVKQAYNEFMPFDGQFRDNVIIQVKNGPIDFQPREPFSPLFGAMKKTPVMAELQITQEYLGHNHQLVFLAPMWEECLQSDTRQQGVGSTVARCTDGSVYPFRNTAIAGVANIGLDKNWCGNVFAPSNWYAFGRLAWDNKLKSAQIADEWLKQTFGPGLAAGQDSQNAGPINAAKDWYKGFLKPVSSIMLSSREAAVQYMMPLGLHHIFAGEHHYGPGPWYAPKGLRADWTPVYYHKADTLAIGFDRTSAGTDAVSQYHPSVGSVFENIKTCPENLLLWFHRVPWTYQMKSGRILWDELCYNYEEGVQTVRQYQKTWNNVQPFVDAERFTAVQQLLSRQERDARIWKESCLLYFQTFSRRPFPVDVETPVYKLEMLKKTDMLYPNID